MPGKRITRRKITFDTVRALARTLPDVEVGTAYGSPAVKVRGKMFACIATHKSAEPNTLVAIVGFEQRDELIASEPDIYYLKPHYLNYPTVLARLTRIHPDALRDLLRMAQRFVSTKSKRRGRAR